MGSVAELHILADEVIPKTPRREEIVNPLLSGVDVVFIGPFCDHFLEYFSSDPHEPSGSVLQLDQVWVARMPDDRVEQKSRVTGRRRHLHFVETHHDRGFGPANINNPLRIEPDIS